MIIIEINTNSEIFIFIGLGLFILLGPTSILFKSIWYYVKFNYSKIIPVNAEVMLLERKRASTHNGDRHRDYILYVLKLDYTVNNKTYEEILKHSKSNELIAAIEEGGMVIYCDPKKPKKYWLSGFYTECKKLSSLIFPLFIALLFWVPLVYGFYIYATQPYL